MTTPARGEVGVFSAVVAVLALSFVMVAGMAYDGGQLVAAHLRAGDLAAGAARAGAQEIDLAVLRASGDPVVDADRAGTAVRDYLAGSGGQGEVSVVGDTVTVTVTVRQRMVILPLPDRAVSATDRATAVTGPEEVSGG